MKGGEQGKGREGPCEQQKEEDGAVSSSRGEMGL